MIVKEFYEVTKDTKIDGVNRYTYFNLVIIGENTYEKNVSLITILKKKSI